MFILDTNKELTYRFNDIVNVVGTLNQIEDIAEKLNLKINYTILASVNGLIDEYYDSEHLGIVYIKDMATEHLKNALLKNLREYFTPENFKDAIDDDFLSRIEDPDFYNSEIKMLYTELSNRLD